MAHIISDTTEITAADVRAAADRIRGAVHATELRRSPTLSARVGGDVYLKLECAQVTGSFKIRGAFNTIASLDDAARRRGVVTSSAGNHGLGVALAARHFGVPATIFVPRTAPTVKRDGIAALGATLDATEADYDAAMARARRLADDRGLRFIHPCLGRELLAGQGTVALEVLDVLPALRTLVVCVGGAGLLGGVASYVREVAPWVRIVGVQSTETAAMARSLAAGAVVDIPSVPTLADGLAGQIDEAALDIGRQGLDDMILLSEQEIAESIAWAARAERLTVEGSGAVAFGAILHDRIADLATPVAAIVSGGNIDPARHADIVSAHAEAAERLALGRRPPEAIG